MKINNYINTSEDDLEKIQLNVNIFKSLLVNILLAPYVSLDLIDRDICSISNNLFVILHDL